MRVCKKRDSANAVRFRTPLARFAAIYPLANQYLPVQTELASGLQNKRLILIHPYEKNPMTSKTTAASETVQTIMSKNVQTVDYNAPVTTALRLMAEDKFSTFPVININRECVGMLSRSDLTATLFAEDQKLAQLLEDGAFAQVSPAFLETCGDKQVREVMTHSVMSVSPDTSIKSACQTMLTERIHHLPVVSEFGFLEGIVSTFDIISWLAKQN